MRYDYVNEDGSIRVERSYPIGEAPTTITEKGIVLHMDRGASIRTSGMRVRTPVPLGGPTQGYWQISRANGCHPSQVEQIKALDRACGAPDIDYVPVPGGMMGAAYSDKRQKNNHLRALKRVDFDACYDAPAPGDFRDKAPRESDIGHVDDAGD